MNYLSDLTAFKTIDIGKIPLARDKRYKLSTNLILKVTTHKDFYLGTLRNITKKLGRYPEMSLSEI